MTLDDLNAHGGIEHDASYTRKFHLLNQQCERLKRAENLACLIGADVKWQPDQSTPNEDIIKGLYETAGLDINNLKSTDTLQVKDFSNYLAYRRAHSKVFNAIAYDGIAFFSLLCCRASIYTQAILVFAGNAADLKTWFLEERIPDNWEPKSRTRYGFTIAQMNQRSFQIGFGISRAGSLEDKARKDAKKN
ncbi:hypothetical protein FRC12_001648 [Ceratobasidium sp. 428]|nr:hypothetical protein FRC12_001648 [Ceratobasidium sp. 428]